MKKSLVFFQIVIFLSVAIIFTSGCEQEEKNTPPVAEFIIMPESGNFETSFSFDASSCSDEQDLSSSLKIRWDWENDGIFDTDFSTNKILEHQFSKPDTFKITLEVIDSDDMGSSLSKILIVNGMIPELVTDSVKAITEYSAFCGGKIIDENGSPVTSRGVCWSTNQDPSTSDDHSLDGDGPGGFISQLTELTPNTTYYVRAYATNIIGTGYGKEVSFITKKLWACGDPLIIDHVAGNVAPVNKTVTYGTVTNIPGEPLKCWIIQNLGADRQGSSVDDATEASAGWYWQFNRKQGYKHDGVNRIPNITWMANIDENLDWIASNDPCTQELGPLWHVPTLIEYQNVILSGGWVELNDAWNSALKIHAAGYLMSENGQLVQRGYSGACWSSTQNPEADGWLLYLPPDTASAIYDLKSHCLTLRCVR